MNRNIEDPQSQINQDESEDPPSPDAEHEEYSMKDFISATPKEDIPANGENEPDKTDSSLLDGLKSFIPWNNKKQETTLRDALEEYIDESNGNVDTTSITAHERMLLSNILDLQDMTVIDLMVPRADIIAIDADSTQVELQALLSEKQHSRFPVYRETLDDVIGTIHIKDILTNLLQGKKIVLKDLVREVPIVSPAMHALDLLFMMKKTRKHMVLVVDEYGGIDGLCTIEDVVEAIVGDIEDEYDQDTQPEIAKQSDGTLIADARYDIDEFEEEHGEFLTEEEREDIDTLGGLANAIAGRVPVRGEILTHSSGMVMEIIDADPRRVNRMLLRNIPVAIEEE